MVFSILSDYKSLSIELASMASFALSTQSKSVLQYIPQTYILYMLGITIFHLPSNNTFLLTNSRLFHSIHCYFLLTSHTLSTITIVKTDHVYIIMLNFNRTKNLLVRNFYTYGVINYNVITHGTFKHQS